MLGRGAHRSRIRVVAGLLALLLSLILAGTAGATVLTAAVTPSGAGTAAAPKPQQLTLDLAQISQGSSGKPTESLTGVIEQLPTDFSDQLALFATCPTSDFQNLTSTPPACPTGSEVGTAAFAAYIPSLISSVSTDEGYIYKTGPSAVMAWVHVNHLTTNAGTETSLSVSIALNGKLTTGTATAGPTVNWDLSPAVDLGVTARISHFQTIWTVNQVAGSTQKPPAKKKPAKHKTKPKKKKHGKSKAKQKITGKKKSTGKKKAGRVANATTTSTAAPATTAASTFESTACTAGNWAFSATLNYQGGATENVSDQVPCATGGTAPPSTPACVQLLILCLPLGELRSSAATLAYRRL
jgi:hypothetical protein